MTDGQQAELYDYNSYGFEEVTNNAPGGQTLANNVSIEGNPAYGLEQITAAAGPLSEDASKLLNILNVTVTDLKKDLDDFAPKLGPLADSLKRDADNIQNVIKNIDGLAKGADAVRGTADKFISTTDKQLQEQLKQLHVTLLNLKVVTTYAKELVETLAQKPNRIIFSGKPATLTPESEILKSLKPLPRKNLNCNRVAMRRLSRTAYRALATEYRKPARHVSLARIASSYLSDFSSLP